MSYFVLFSPCISQGILEEHNQQDVWMRRYGSFQGVLFLPSMGRLWICHLQSGSPGMPVYQFHMNLKDYGPKDTEYPQARYRGIEVLFTVSLLLPSWSRVNGQSPVLPRGTDSLAAGSDSSFLDLHRHCRNNASII
jgi:hypothetical protein